MVTARKRLSADDERRIVSDGALQIVAENKIRAVIGVGEFDNLPGCGRTCKLIDEPYNPHRWTRRKLTREELFISPEAFRST